jgi:hypothetical protein
MNDNFEAFEIKHIFWSKLPQAAFIQLSASSNA